MKRFLVLCFILFFGHFSYAQNNIAILKYEEAETAYGQADYTKVLQLIEEVEDINGVTSGTLYLKIVAKAKLFNADTSSELDEADKTLLGDLRRHTRLYIDAMQEHELDDHFRTVQQISEMLMAYPNLAPPPADYANVQIQPAPPQGDLKAFANWVAENYVFPTDALEAKVSGTVKVGFIVERDGSLSEIDIIQDLGYGTGKALVQVLQQSGKWSPGIEKGRPVRIAYTIPLTLSAPQ